MKYKLKTKFVCMMVKLDSGKVVKVSDLTRILL